MSETPNIARLIQAVKAGDVAIARKLIDARPELVKMDTSENDEHRAIHHAVLTRNQPMIRMLMEAGADARQGIWPHRDATSAFVLARDRGFTEITAIIEEVERGRVEKSDAPGGTTDCPEAETPIHEAIKLGDEPRVRELIQADPAALRRITDDGGLLTFAVNHGRADMVRLLLDLGADVDERITLANVEEPTLSWGMPLWHAARNNQFELCKLLL